MRRKKKTPLFADLKITSINRKGHGLALWNRNELGETQVEIPFTMTGDEVKCCIRKRRQRVYLASIEEIIKPASERIPAKCIHYGICGGCRLQHQSYQYQLAYKESIIRQDFADLLSPTVTVYPILPCDPPWEYRNKMEYSFSSDKAGNKYLGLIQEGSQKHVLNLVECHLTKPWFVDALKAVKHWWMESKLDAFHLSKNTGALRNLTLREGCNTGDRMVILNVSGNPEFALKQSEIDSFLAFVRNAVELPTGNLSIFLRIHQIAKGMSSSFYEMHLYGPDHITEVLKISLTPDNTTDVKFHISPTAFFQPNTRQAEKLYSRVMQLAKIGPDDVVYDLYCGIGSLGLCAAKLAKHVVAVELMPESTLDAKLNAKSNHCENITIITGAIRYILTQENSEALPPPTIILVDPPRAGLDPQAKQNILDLKASKIVYVSCNTKTQAEDIKVFVNAGYRLVAIQPVDQFPQTVHIENIVLLEKL